MIKIIILFVSFNLFAANHYVDKNANGLNNGTSWTNAWESFGDISWGSVNAGDIIYISGGTDSTVYYERLYIGDVQGTANDRVTIRNSWESGHNGRVIIDGSNGTRDCIALNSSAGGVFSTDYITIYGLELRGGRYCVYVHYYVDELILDSLYVYDWTVQGLQSAGTEIPTKSQVGLTVQNCDFISLASSATSEDNLLFNSTWNVVVRNNFIHMRNSIAEENNHADGILLMQGGNVRIYNNVFVVDSNGQGQAYIVRAFSDPDGEDSVIAYNNFFYSGGIWDSNDKPWTSNVNFRWLAEGSQVEPPTYFAHNTLITWGEYAHSTVWEVTTITMVNNIVTAFGDGVGGIDDAHWFGDMRGSAIGIPVDSVRSNIIWREYESLADRSLFSGNAGSWVGNATSGANFNWAYWTGTLGGTGINDNPDFVLNFNEKIPDQANMHGELTDSSVAINAGEDVQAVIEGMGLDWVDIGERIEGRLGITIGNTRNSSADSVTIGAYNPSWLRSEEAEGSTNPTKLIMKK